MSNLNFGKLYDYFHGRRTGKRFRNMRGLGHGSYLVYSGINTDYELHIHTRWPHQRKPERPDSTPVAVVRHDNSVDFKPYSGYTSPCENRLLGDLAPGWSFGRNTSKAQIGWVYTRWGWNYSCVDGQIKPHTLVAPGVMRFIFHPKLGHIAGSVERVPMRVWDKDKRREYRERFEKIKADTLFRAHLGALAEPVSMPTTAEGSNDWRYIYNSGRLLCEPLETNHDYAKMATYAQRDKQHGYRRNMSQAEFLQWWMERETSKEQLRLSTGAVTYQVDFSAQES